MEIPPNLKSESDDSDFVKNLVSESGVGDQKILDTAPELDKSLIEEVSPPMSVLLVLLKTLTVLLILGGTAVAGFFTIQLTDYFTIVNQKLEVPNLAADLTTKNQDIIKEQTNINFYRYLQAKAYLDKFSYDADSYLQNYEIYISSTSSKEQRDQAKQTMADVRTKLKESFLAARGKLVLPIGANLATKGLPEEEPDSSQTFTDPNQKFIAATVAKLQEEANQLVNNTDEAAKLDYKNYIYAANLVSNSPLRAVMTDVDFDKLSNSELYDLIRAVDLLALNDFSIIQKIKELRIKWSDIIHEIDVVTIIADGNYTKDDYDSYGGIRYTSYSFDSDSRQISVVGDTKKSDTTTFTTISNLIDALNKSDLFEGAEMRSFSKSGSSDTGYTSNLRISFDLIGAVDAILAKNATVAPVPRNVTEVVPAPDAPPVDTPSDVPGLVF